MIGQRNMGRLKTNVGKNLETLMAARPDVLAHNVEVVHRLQRKIRDPRCSFEQSLRTLAEARRCVPQVVTKSSLMLGLGETHAEIIAAMILGSGGSSQPGERAFSLAGSL